MGQATAHALKLSWLLHRAQSTDRHVVTERVCVVLVMDSAEQLIIETKAFHEAPSLEATVLMQHSLSINSDVI